MTCFLQYTDLNLQPTTCITDVDNKGPFLMSQVMVGHEIESKIFNQIQNSAQTLLSTYNLTIVEHQLISTACGVNSI